MKPETIQWEAAEHKHKERSVDWFWTVGIVVVAGAITAIILENFLFAIVILLAGFAITLFNARRPVVHEFELSQRGLRIRSNPSGSRMNRDRMNRNCLSRQKNRSCRTSSSPSGILTRRMSGNSSSLS